MKKEKVNVNLDAMAIVDSITEISYQSFYPELVKQVKEKCPVLTDGAINESLIRIITRNNFIGTDLLPTKKDRKKRELKSHYYQKKNPHIIENPADSKTPHDWKIWVGGKKEEKAAVVISSGNRGDVRRYIEELLRANNCKPFIIPTYSNFDGERFLKPSEDPDNYQPMHITDWCKRIMEETEIPIYAKDVTPKIEVKDDNN